MTPDLHLLYLARIVIETQTPLSVSTGSRDGVFDTALVRDANGVPTIPGGSIAGVLRHLYTPIPSGPDVNSVFGFAEGRLGAPSRLQVSWGCLHGADDQPIEGLLLDDQASKLDAELLRNACDAHPLVRDHVRITDRGTASSQGKFDRTAIHAGHRFSVELRYWCAERHDDAIDSNDGTWLALLSLFRHPGFRLGGQTRQGFGAVQLIRAHSGRFNLKDPDDYARFAQLSPSVGQVQGLVPVNPDTNSSGWVTCDLTLKPEGGWRFGQGEAPRTSGERDPDLLPVAEHRIVWKNGTASLAPTTLVVPGSGLKGALAHRVAFHHNRLNRCWLTDQDQSKTNASETDRDAYTIKNPSVLQLFGHAKQTRPSREDAPRTAQSSNGERGRAGRVYFDDTYVVSQPPVLCQWHNSIDRFTGGTRKHVLYGEELVWKSSFRVRLSIGPAPYEIDPIARKALALALEDLCEGRLAIGGGGAKGHGYCEGQYTWSDGGAWVGAPA